MASIHSLPNEVLLIIFEMMPLGDRSRAFQVCRKFCSLALLDVKGFSIHGPCQHRLAEDLVRFIGDQIVGFQFHDIDLGRNFFYRSMLRHFSSKLTTIHLLYVDQPRHYWEPLIVKFGPQLEEFALQGCCLDRKTEKLLLDHLNPACIRKLCVDLSITNSLRKFCRKFRQLTYLKSSIWKVPQFRVFKYVPNLKSLDLTVEDEIDTFEWLSLQDPITKTFAPSSLKTLLIQGSVDIESSNSFNVFSRLNVLKHLKIDIYTDIQLNEILIHTPHLTSLEARATFVIDGTIMSSITKLRKLAYLTMYWPTVIFQNDFMDSLLPMPAMKNFSFHSFQCPRPNKEGNEMISNLSTIFPNLKTFIFRSAHWIVPHAFLMCVLQLPLLTGLRIFAAQQNIPLLFSLLDSLMESKKGDFYAQACCNYIKK